MKLLLSFLLSLSSITSSAPTMYNAKTNEPGTTFTFVNQTVGVIEYFYGECGPLPSGGFLPSKDLKVFVADKAKLKITFRGSYTDPACKCKTFDLLGKSDVPEKHMPLSMKDFCKK